MAQILEAPFYNQLRTEKQLGYVVNVGSLPLLDVPGMSFLIQSPTSAPLALEGEIDDFLRRFEQVIAAMPDAVFDEHKAGLLSRINNRDERLRQRSDRYWNELDLGHLAFDFRERLAEAVSALDRDELISFYRRALIDASARRMVISTTGAATAEQESGADDATVVRITDPDAFSTGRTLSRAPLKPKTARRAPGPGNRPATG
jgi:secreted Zn-dependent insulinase-like peptidase